MSEHAHGWSTEEVVGLLQQVDLFEGLPEEDLSRVASIVKRAEVGDGEELFKEGEPGDAFYIVFEGAIEISKARSDGSSEKLAVRRKGDAFGEMALLDDAPRSAGAKAVQASKLIMVSQEDFRNLLGGDTLSFRMMQSLSKALRALGIRFASTEKIQDRGSRARSDAFEISRVMQAGLLPQAAPRVPGYDVAAGTTTEPDGRGSSLWDWLELGGGAFALITVDVNGDGFPPAYHLGNARTGVRAAVNGDGSVESILQRTNDLLAGTAVPGLEQFVDMGVLIVDPDGVHWASAGRPPGGIIRRDGTFEQLGAQGPPLGMMAGFKYRAKRFPMSAGDTAFVLSRGSQGLLVGAADLLAQLHGKPAGEIVSQLHKAIRKASEGTTHETSVLYVRKH